MRVSHMLALIPAAALLAWVAGGGIETGHAGPRKLGGAAESYHGQMGATGEAGGGGFGMLERWCALPNFSFEQEGGIAGWTSPSKDCNGCHIGASWNATKPEADCTYCHDAPGAAPPIANCMTCHKEDTSKRGDLFDADSDAHVAAGMVCQDCHERTTDKVSDHQLRKGTALDTTEPTMEGTLSCTSCHKGPRWHRGVTDGATLDGHTAKVACETCHTGLRPAAALAGRDWTTFVSGKPYTWTRPAGWKPVHKWYDRTGAGAAGGYLLPILGGDERKDARGAQIFPFNDVEVTWYVDGPTSDLDDVIVPSRVKAADADGNGHTTLAEMQAVVPGATLVTRKMTFSIHHSVLPASEAATCGDCHGKGHWLLDWEALGYDEEPRPVAGNGRNR